MEQLRAWWQNLPSERKWVVAVIAGAGIGALLLAFALLGRQGNWLTLYSRLSPDDLAAASAELARVGIPYEVVEANGALRVPPEKAAQARMVLAQVGLPKTGAFSVAGFELLDQTSFATSDFLQHTNYLRALQGELARSIATLEPIAHARVHLNLPQPTVFEEQQQEPSASVVVSLRPKRSLSPAQTKAIVFLVAQAIEGLKPENIVVVDTQGNLLWEQGTAEDGLAGVSGYLQLRWQTERMIEQQLQNFLDRTLGVGKVSVKVSAEVETEKRQSESETYLPLEGTTQGVPLTQSETNETYQAQGLPNGGVAGAASNLQPAPPTPVALLGGSYTKTERKTEYRVSRRIERIEHLPGSVKRLSVSVLVPKEMSSAEQAALRQAISAAVGVDTGRGDTVVVVPVRAERALAGAPEISKERGRGLRAPKLSWWWLAAAIPVLLLTTIPFVAWRRWRRAIPPAPSLPEGTKAPPSLRPSEARPAEEGASEESAPVEKLRELARREPERLADLMRAWMTEGSTSEVFPR